MKRTNRPGSTATRRRAALLGAVAFPALCLSTMPANAEDSLFDGFYAGGFGALGSIESTLQGPRPAEGTVANTDLGDSGFGAGLFGGYGRTFGDFYLGGELAAGVYDIQWESENLPNARRERSKLEWDAEASVRGGYLINPATLLYVRAGAAVAGYDSIIIRRTGARHEGTDELVGFRYGIGAEAAATENLFLRLDLSQTRYDDYSLFFEDGTDEYKGVTDTMLRLGLGYRFSPDGAEMPEFASTADGLVDGLYVGAKTGYGFLNSNQEGPRAGNNRLEQDVADGNPAGGVFVGAGKRIDRLYLGGEIEATAGDISARQEAVVGGRLQHLTKEYDVAALFRGGYYLNPALLLYGKAGVAMGNYEADVRLGDGRSFEQDEYLLGLRGGIGLEVAFDSHFFGILDYTYTEFERFGVDRSSPGQIAAGTPFIEEFTPEESMFWIGVGYRFGGNETADGQPVALSFGPDGDGVRLGSFVLLPELAISETYNDNIFATETGEIDDFLTTISPSVALNSDWDDHLFNVWGLADIVRYGDNDAEDHEHYSLGADGRYDISGDTNLFGGGAYTRDIEDRDSPDDVNGSEPTELTVQNAYAGGFHRFGAPAVRLGGTATVYDFDDTPAAAGTINNDDRDRNVYTGGIWAGYQAPDAPEFWVQYALDIRDYDQQRDDFGFARSSDGYRALAGINVEIGTDIEGTAYIGYMKQDYDDGRLSDIGTGTYGGSIDWSITPATRASGYVDRVIGETTLINASGSIDTTYGLAASQQITEDLRADTGFAFTTSEYQGVSRDDNYVSVNVGMSYSLTEAFSLDAEYRHDIRETDVPGQNYNRNVVTLRVTGAW